MSLKIILGRAGSGKTAHILKDMPEGAIYIVPEQFSFSAEKKLTEEFGVCGLGNPQALSFMRLADLVFSRYGAPEFIADNASFEMLVSYCANSISPDKLTLFDGLVKKSELSLTASNLITTFKRYGVTCEKLALAAEKTDDPLLRKKLLDSKFIYERYLAALKEANLCDKLDTLAVLADILSDEDCDFLCGKHIYIDQFSAFDPGEYECIKIMLKRAERVCVALCTDKGEPFYSVNQTYERLLKIAESVNTPVEPEEFLTTAMHGAKPMIKHLEKNYFEDSAVPLTGNDGSVFLFCGKNKFSEIHNAARNIIKLVRDEKMRFRDISVVARDAESYKSVIDRIFPFYDIPVFIDRKAPLSSHCVTVFITSILDIAIGGFTYENIFTYIKSPFSPLTLEEADELENYVLSSGIRPYAWKKPFTAKCSVYDSDNGVYSRAVAGEKLERLNALREKVYNPLSSFISKLEKKAPAKEICRVLFDFFEETGFSEKIENYAVLLEEDGENLHALQTKQVYNILTDIFTDLCAVLGEKTLSLREFYSTMLAGFKSVEIGTIPTSADCVSVGSIDRIKGHGARAVFLIGANSGVFPKALSENGIFSDDDKAFLERNGIEMPPSLKHLAQSERLLVYDALTCAGEKLFISYSSADSASNALLPSEIPERVRALFPSLPLYDDLLSLPEDKSIITSKKAVFDILSSKLRPYIQGEEELSPVLSAAAFCLKNDPSFSPLLENALSLTAFSNSASVIEAPLLEKAIGKNMKTSVTRLESYNKCPFSYFAKYLLKLEPKKALEISTSDSGSFLHDFIDRFSQFLTNSKDENGVFLTWHTIDDDFIRINTPPILREVLCSVNPLLFENPRIKALFDRLCRVAEQSLYIMRRHITKSDFVPLGYEISFDEDGRFKPTKITLDDGKKVTLRGRIDRADEFKMTMPDGTEGSFVRIVDYKSSEKTLSLSDVYHGLQLQLFVYLSNLCENGYKPAGILYYNLSDPIVETAPDATADEILQKRFEERRMSGIVLEENDMTEHMGAEYALKTKKTVSAKNFNSMFRHLNTVIKNTAQSIYGGEFPINCTRDACTWCEYSHLCRFESGWSGCTERGEERLKDNEVWQLLEEGGADNEMD